MRLITTLIVLLATTQVTAFGEDGYPKDWFWGSTAQRQKHEALTGKPAPALALRDADGKETTLGDTAGKVVVVDFWATWCGPCRAALPENVALMKEYKDDGLLIVGVHDSKRGWKTMNDIAEKYELNYPLHIDRGESQGNWKVGFWPTIAVVDQEGIVRAVGLKPNHLRAVVEDLLEKDDADSKANPDKPKPPRWEDVKAEEKGTPPPFPKDFNEGKPDRRKQLDAMLGKAPPELEVITWINSDSLDLAALKGKVVLLDFWATWCGPCIASIPKNNALAEKYADDLVVIGICHDRGHEKMAQVGESRGIKYPICHDAGNTTKDAYKVDSYPDYYLIDRQGRLRLADCANSKVEEAIKTLIAEDS